MSRRLLDFIRRMRLEKSGPVHGDVSQLSDGQLLLAVIADIEPEQCRTAKARAIAVATTSTLVAAAAELNGIGIPSTVAQLAAISPDAIEAELVALEALCGRRDLDMSKMSDAEIDRILGGESIR